MSEFVRFEHVSKTYHVGEVDIHALQDASFTVNEGELCVIVGPSGAGKTTLLNILGGMDTLTSGRILLGDREISAYNTRQLTTYRRHDIGFVFQFYNLIPNLTALENVELAAQICEHPLDAAQVLTSVGLEQRLAEVGRLGFTKCMIPSRGSARIKPPKGLDLIRVSNIREAIAAFL